MASKSMFNPNRQNGGGGGGGSVTVVDNLNSTSTTDALSANQGKLLNDKITEINTKITASENLKIFDQELYGMRVFNNEFQYFNTTTGEWVTIQGGSSTADVIDNLISTDATKALSANQGRVLDEKITTHENKIASSTTLGHVKVDGISVKAMVDGTLYVTESVKEPVKLENYQYVLPTTEVGQSEWEIPLVDFDKDKDTILVSHNTTWLTNKMYEIISIGGVNKLKILNNLPTEIEKNNVFITILRSVGNANNVSGVTKVYSYELPTIVEAQKSWKIPLDTFNPSTDSMIVYHNSTYLAPSMWNVSLNPAGGYDLNFPMDKDIAINENNMDIVIYKDAPIGSDGFISGNVLLDKSITIDKLSIELQNIIKNSSSPKTSKFKTATVSNLDYNYIYKPNIPILETDDLDVVYNSTTLEDLEWDIMEVGGEKVIKLNISQSSEIENNIVHGRIYRNFGSFS